MNKIEHLLTCLAEECAEVAKEASKSLRFGLEDKVTRNPAGPRGTEGPTNAEKIENEMVDLLAVYEMLVVHGAVSSLDIEIGSTLRQKMYDKQSKVRAYMVYAVSTGALCC